MDDDDRSDRWRMRPPPEEDDDPDDEEDLEYARLPRSELRAIATDQKGIIVCILLNMGLAAASLFIPRDNRVFAIIGLVALGIAGTILVFLLATKVYGSAAGIALGIVTLVPCIGLIVLLLINAKATNILKLHKVHVGLFGAKMSDI